ncbi:Tctr2 protein [Cucurbitaria berberidis CBS 394.84]|uniref:Copper transport protein n=1 Tax=Cucurbitaria berberidis CBS 394.84 TaxID=1168544 RepID=A0A9P4GNS6_9PLEO|nr:Tctr2 protein [Cucurbitaria berberidis CBS 394.84]KAF1848411.1 Tctr2 protein [Cucurbitaria berberidis CBS 394.84]
MLWNWYTVDSCFIARSWHITSKGMFTGNYIGVVLLVVFLNTIAILSHKSASPDNGTSKIPPTNSSVARAPVAASNFRPSVLQQTIRALLHMLQFAVAYFVMLLALYYNGYIIICIFIGAYFGYFVFCWESFNVGQGGKDRM